MKVMRKSITQLCRIECFITILFLLLLGIIGCQSPPIAKNSRSIENIDKLLPGEHLLPFSHSHNDYEHYPVNATYLGFNSLEVDVHLRNGILYVAHDEEDIREEHTLKSMYLDMLQKRLGGRDSTTWFYSEKKPLTLMIDIKSDSVSTYEVLIKELEPIRDYLTTFSNQGIHYKELLVVISGNRPKQRMLQDSIRYAAYDGRLSDLNKTFPANFLYWISDNWEDHFYWRGDGAFSPSEIIKLESIAALAQKKGVLLRFWKTPDKSERMRERTWGLLLSAGVDIIGTDHIAHLHDYLKERQR